MAKKTLEFVRKTLEFPAIKHEPVRSVSPVRLDPKTGVYHKTPIAKAIAKKYA